MRVPSLLFGGFLLLSGAAAASSFVDSSIEARARAAELIVVARPGGPRQVADSVSELPLEVERVLKGSLPARTLTVRLLWSAQTSVSGTQLPTPGEPALFFLRCSAAVCTSIGGPELTLPTSPELLARVETSAATRPHPPALRGPATGTRSRLRAPGVGTAKPKDAAR